ncbi:hypothetical protein GOBAR_AA06934 [Gossypium barbadense]|uniref:Uncharacterized protein n=1 Tax=Gossypium barbadense TaxID=3634 RepID=A0A2P5YDM5_GOSBA|nr:hypothetical protein GOBAR_AA06934 [Gossypium barbadense]
MGKVDGYGEWRIRRRRAGNDWRRGGNREEGWTVKGCRWKNKEWGRIRVALVDGEIEKKGREGGRGQLRHVGDWGRSRGVVRGEGKAICGGV